MAPTRRAVHITLEGEVGPATREAFADVDVRVAHGNTFLSAPLVDQAALHAVLERVQALGLLLVEMHVGD
jgi:hypothetical protein